MRTYLHLKILHIERTPICIQTLDIDYKLFTLYPLYDKLLYLEIETFISELGAFPLVTVWVQQWGAWKHAPM